MRKTAEVTGDLIGNKIADKITSVNKTKPRYGIPLQEIYIPTKNVNKSLMI